MADVREWLVCSVQDGKQIGTFSSRDEAEEFAKQPARRQGSATYVLAHVDGTTRRAATITVDADSGTCRVIYQS